MRDFNFFLGVLAVGCSGLLALPAWSQSQPPAALKIVVVEGDGAINNIRERSARAPVVRLEDDDARPVAGATVTFVLPEFGAGATFPDGHTTLTTTTDRDGLAAARGMRPNNVAGRFQMRVNASYRGRSATATITQINAEPAAARGGRGKKIAIAALAAGAVAGVVAAFAGGGKGGAAVSSAPSSPGTTLAPGAPVFGPPR